MSALYTAAEIAAELGHGADWFYRNYQKLVDQCGMPPAIVPFGHYRFRRDVMDRWLAARKNPAFNNAAANDDGAIVLPELDAVRAALATEYASR